MILCVSKSRLKVLLTVYSASPAAESEPLKGYKYVRELHRVADIKVIAHARDEAAMSRTAFADHVHYAGNAALAGSIRAITGPSLGHRTHLIGAGDFLDYLYFDIDALRLARALHRRYGFELVHRITPTTIRFPSVVWQLGLPVVSGPHNGGMTWPSGFRHLARREGTFDRVRGIGNTCHALFRDLAHYARILTANDQCRGVVPRRYWDRVLVMPSNGVEATLPTSRYAGDATRLLFVGRLVPVKCVDLLVRAMSRLPGRVCLTIVGDGSERTSLEALAADLGVAHRITFTGWVPQPDTYKYYQEAGVFVFPSVRDSGPAVVLEAMASGLPTLVAAWAGPLQFIGRDAGVPLSVASPRALEDDIVRTVERLLSAPALGQELSQKAKLRVTQHFTWPQKARNLIALYKQVRREWLQ